MLPFLKNRDDAAGSSPVEVLERKPDEDQGLDMIDAVAEDILAAIAAKDKELLKQALESLVSHIQSQDQAQDAEPPA